TVGDREIQRAVAIEIADRQGLSSAAGREAQRRLEGSITIAKEHQNVAAATTRAAGHGQVDLAIAVEVAHRDGGRTEVRTERSIPTPSRLEGPITATRQHPDSSNVEGREQEVLRVGYHQVELA